MGNNLLKLYSRIFLHFARSGRTDGMPDPLYLRMTYLARVGHFLHLKQPRSFNEKLQWLKLYYRKPEYTALVDKYAVKQWVAEKIGEQYVIPTLGVWDRFEDIDFDSLPDQFVLKCTHDSGGLVIVKEKSSLDLQKAREKIERSLRNNYYYHGREWYYRDVKPRILAEKYMEDPEKADLQDYKYMCFNGKVRCAFVCSERFTEGGVKVTFFDEQWNRLPFERAHPSSSAELPEPECHKEMMALAEKLSEGMPFVRVDFYQTGGKVYFGEMTFFPGGGFEPFTPEEWDRKLGQWLKLPDQA